MYYRSKECIEYQLTIISVTMKVKFPCKLKIEHLGSMIAPQVPPSDNDTYIFNQQVCLTDQQQRDSLELTFNLVTEMGSKYLAGVVKIYTEQMLRSQGQTLHLNLVRCLDTQAKCEIKVDQVLRKNSTISVLQEKREMKRYDGNNFRSNERSEIERSPTMKNINGGHKHINSKTQYQFPLGKTVGSSPEWPSRSKFQPAFQQLQSPSSKMHEESHISSKDYNISMKDNDDSYRQAYVKMKQKYRKLGEEQRQQIERRKGVQNSNNGLKLELMRFKMKIEELERVLAEKQKKQREEGKAEAFLKQSRYKVQELTDSLTSKDQHIEALQNALRVLSQRLEDANRFVQGRETEQKYKIRELQLQLQDIQKQFSRKEKESKYLLEVSEEQLRSKDKQIQGLAKAHEELLQKNNAYEYTLQSKQLQFERSLDIQKRSTLEKNEELNSKIALLESRIKEVTTENESLENKIHEFEIGGVRGQYDRQILQQECLNLKEQLREYKQKAENYPVLLRNNQVLTEDKDYLQKKLEKLNESQQENDSFVAKQFQEQIQYFKEIVHQNEVSLELKSKEMLELQKTTSELKIQNEKMKKNIQELTQQLAEAKEKEKAARRNLLSKEKQFFGAETEHATLKEKVKNIDQIYQLETDKLKTDLQKAELVLNNERIKSRELQLKCQSLTYNLNQIQTQLSNFKEQFQKQSSILAEKDNQMEITIKEYEQKLSTLEKLVSMLKTAEKEAIFRMKKIQLQSAHFEERMEKMKSSYSKLQQNCIELSEKNKNQATQIIELTQEKDQLRQLKEKLQCEVGERNHDILESHSEKNKCSKALQIIQEQLEQTKRQLEGTCQQLGKKDQIITKLENDSNSLKQEMSKVRIKNEMLRKEGDRFRGEVFEGMAKNCSVILGHNSQRKNKGEGMEKNELNFAEFLSILNSHFKELRSDSARKKESISNLQISVSLMKNSKEELMNASQKKEYDLKNEMARLQAELQKLIEERQSESLNFTTIITEMKKKMEEGEKLQQELNSQIQELNFTVNSTKMDYEALTDENNRKLIQMNKINSQLSKQNEQLTQIISQLEEKVGSFQSELQLINSHLADSIEQNEKKEKKIEEYSQTTQLLQTQNHDFKRNNKQLMQTISQFQLQLQHLKEENQKLKGYLSQEERKNSEIKQFVNNLMREKEISIRKEVQSGEEIMTLQSEITEKTKDLEILTEQCNRLKKLNDELKDSSKKQAASNKDLMIQLRDLKSELLKAQEKIKEKQLLLKYKEESLQALELKYQTSAKTYKIDFQSVLNDCDKKVNLLIQEKKILEDRIKGIESALEKKTIQYDKLEQKIGENSQAMYQQHQNIEMLKEKIEIKMKQNQELKDKNHQLDSNINQISDQLRDKEQKLFDLSGTIFALEKKAQAEMQEKYEILQGMEIQFTNKYDMTCYDYEQKLQMLEKEKDFYKKELDEKEKDITKKNTEIYRLEERESTLRKSMEDRIYKVEEQKISISSLKNNQINQISQQNTTLIQALKQKQTQNRKLTSELEISRRSITNLEYRMREFQEKITNQGKQYQTEVDFYKRKESDYRSFREAASTRQWNMEREVKKILQLFLRNYLSIVENQENSKVVELARGLEGSILEAVSTQVES